jgi:hypothetical protein
MTEKSELYLGNGQHLTVKSSYLVEMRDQLKLLRNDDSITLNVKITANFENLPDEYHQIFLQMMSARYGGTINCYSNITPFQIPKPYDKKWFQFWK